MTITAEEIKQVILDEDDFGHELRVGQVFAQMASQWNSAYSNVSIDTPQHGGTYTDPATGKPRQFDYRCRILCDDSPNHWTKSALFAVECKNLHKSAPLVICGRPRTEPEAYHAFIESKYNLSKGAVSYATKTAHAIYFYNSGQFVGKSLLRLKVKNGKLETDSNSEIYDRWSQALASSVELAESACSFAVKADRRFSTFVFPVVVVPDESLWTVTYDDAGQIASGPTLVDSCEYFVEKRFKLGVQPFVLTHIHFTTIRGFADFLSNFWKRQLLWIQWMFPENSQNLTAN